MEKPEVQARLAVFQSVFSFDLQTQLHGLTLYGTSTVSHDGVLLLYADFDPAKLVTLAKAANEPQSAPYKQHVIYSWIDEHPKKHTNDHSRTYAVIKGQCVIFGQRQERVAAALDVLDGEVPNMAAGTALPELGAAGDNSFIEAGVRKFDMTDANRHAALLRLSKQLILQIHQSQQIVAARLTLLANSDEVATQMASVAQGLIALMKLQSDRPEAPRLAEALHISQDGPRVVATLSLPGNNVVEMLKGGAARKAARKAEKE
jgi:hypothetical protein